MPGEYPLSPRLEGTPAKPTSPCTASAPPAGLESSPLPEVQPTPASPLRDTNSAVQCYGITKAGRRCNQRVRGGPALLYQSPEVHVERYCHHHIPVILRPSGFHSLATGEWIEFSDWVEDYLQPATQAALRAEMVKYVSDSDEDGYIYAYEIRSSRTRNEFHIKIGRSVNFIRRLDDWSKHSANHPNLLPGMINPGEKGKYCHRLERLIHLELADIALNSTHLTPYFKKQASAQRANIHTRRSKTHSSSKPKEKPSSRHVKKPCPDCGKRHKEIFTLERGTSSKLRGQEWEGIVKPIIEKWGRFVAEHASKRR
ncbi:hypothetical protein FRC11_010007 [Ceratobasidium sp. 423]|nr:hypothetical protein FRC11_010007 [Ceratobasidium sp. 423]